MSTRQSLSGLNGEPILRPNERGVRATADQIDRRFAMPACRRVCAAHPSLAVHCRGRGPVAHTAGSAWHGEMRQRDWLDPARRRRIFAGCPNSGPFSWHEKIPDLAGRSMFFGLMARRKWSRVSPSKNRPLSGSPNIPRIDRARQAKIPRHEPAGFVTTVSLKNRHANRRPGVRRGAPVANRGSTTVPKAVLANPILGVRAARRTIRRAGEFAEMGGE
jgi:hypothetical protein